MYIYIFFYKSSVYIYNGLMVPLLEPYTYTHVFRPTYQELLTPKPQTPKLAILSSSDHADFSGLGGYGSGLQLLHCS